MSTSKPRVMSQSRAYSQPRVSGRCIALFVPSFRGGGAERAMLLFAEGLVKLGYEVDFLVAQNEGPLKNSLPKGVRLVDLGKRKVSYTLPALVRYLRKAKPVAFYSTIVNANIVALIAATIARIDCRVVVRESNLPNPEHVPTFARRIVGKIAPLFYRRANFIIAVSKDVADALCSMSPKLAAKVSILPNPVVSERIFALAEVVPLHEWFVSQGRDGTIPVILSIGRLHQQKDFASLITAFSEVRKVRKARLMIFGEGSERKKLEALIARLGLEHDVALPGYVENPFPYLKRAQVFVSSSRYEGMPNALLQAMAFGVPIVATDCEGGAREVLRHHEHGRLVAVGDIRQMATEMVNALDQPRSAEAAKFVADGFSVERATSEYLRVAGLSA